MFELYSNVRIFIRILKECVFSTCSWKVASSDDVGKLPQEVADILEIVHDSGTLSREQSWESVMVVGEGE